jgi:CRP-like cAMP-binding protein
MKDILRGLPLFAGLPEGPLDDLALLCRHRRLAEGERLFEEGDAGTEVFVVISGIVRISKRVAIGGERTLATLEAGAMFGEAAIIDQEERSASASARTPVELLVVPADPMREWLIANPGMGVMVLGRLGSMMLDRLRNTNGLLRETVAWGVEVAGAARVGLESLVTAHQTVSIQLLSGRDVRGRLVKAEEGPGGLELWISSPDGRVHLVPYSSIAELVLDLDLPALAGEGS